MERVPPVVISGSIAIDRIMSFRGKYRDLINPEKIDSLSVSVILDELHNLDGGNGANIAYTLALLGETPILLGSVGKESVSYLEKLAHVGINIKYVHESDLSTASFTVITDDDQNQVGGFYPGAMSDSSTLTLRPWKDDAPIVVVAPHDPDAMRRLVAECKQWELRLCYDVGQQVSNLSGKDMALGVEAAEILMLNDYELSVLCAKTGMSPDEIKAKVPVVVTTFGKSGSVIEGSSIDKAIRVGVARAAKIVDPTGAGDAYRAGFMYAYARKWSFTTAAQLGALCATYTIEAAGPQGHSFTHAEIAKRYKTSFAATLPK